MVELDSITYGWLSNKERDYIFKRFGRIGRRGWRKIRFIPVRNIKALKQELLEKEFEWSDEREKIILSKRFDYRIRGKHERVHNN